MKENTCTMTQWSNELILRFLEIYKRHPVIWDPGVYGRTHANRRAISEAWLSVSKELGDIFAVEALKKKKESLMASYRLLKRRTQTGHKTAWFAFDLMDSFLSDVVKHVVSSRYWETVEDNNSDTNGCSETDASANQDVKLKEPYDDFEDQSNDFIEPSSPENASQWPSELELKRKNSTSNSQTCERPAKKTRLNNHTEVVDPLSPAIEKRTSADECSLYGQLLACKLQTLNSRTRIVVMNQIDNLIFKATLTELDSQSTDSADLGTEDVDVDCPP